jgi:hypothetical protein
MKKLTAELRKARTAYSKAKDAYHNAGRRNKFGTPEEIAAVHAAGRIMDEAHMAQHKAAAQKVVDRLGWKGKLSEGEPDRTGRGYTFTLEILAAVLPTPEQVNAGELADALELITEYMEESHQPEIDDEHGGDKPLPDGSPCSYCRAIKQARAALKKAGR